MRAPLRVLFVAAPADARENTLGALRRNGFEPVGEAVQSHADFTRILRNEDWDVVLGWEGEVPFDGIAAAQVIRNGGGDVPVIIVLDAQHGVKPDDAQSVGAQDWVFSDELQRLPRAIQRVLHEHIRHREMQRAIEGARRAAKRYRDIFDAASVALWEVDLSQLRSWLTERSIDEADSLLDVLATSPDVLREIASHARILDVNEAAVALVGASRKEDLIGPLDRLCGRGLEAVRRAVVEALVEGKQTFEREITVKTAHGEEVHVLIAARLGFTVEELKSVIVTTFDVTARRVLENQVRAAHRMEAVGRLAAGVAHDFNNLLTVIQSYTNFLKDDSDWARRREADLEAIEEAASKGVELTGHLLAFGRGQVQELDVVDLNEVIRGLDRILGRLIGEDVKVSVILDAALGRVEVDPTQIERIILNLAANARDAMPEGGELFIETKNADLKTTLEGANSSVPPGIYSMLSVRDTGVGIDEMIQGHIFEPFFTTKEWGEGTGLGLSTVYGIVRQSRGYLSVDSTVGGGTTIRIYLPHAEPRARSTARAEPERQLIGGTETILVVEDETLVRRAVRRILERHGYRVFEAEDGRVAWQVAEAHRGQIDVLLTDVVMPQIGGRELAMRMGSLQPNLRTVFMSGYTEGGRQGSGPLPTGAVYVQKPFSSARLLGAVRKALGDS